MTFLDRINSVRRIEQLVLGAMALLAGADKFTNVFVDWTKYLNPTLAHLLPVSAPVFMAGVGVIEMLVGAAILTKWTRLGAYVACAWLLAIAANLAVGGFYDIAVRDVVIAASAFSLARLTEAMESASERDHPQISRSPAFTD